MAPPGSHVHVDLTPTTSAPSSPVAVRLVLSGEPPRGAGSAPGSAPGSAAGSAPGSVAASPARKPSTQAPPANTWLVSVLNLDSLASEFAENDLDSDGYLEDWEFTCLIAELALFVGGIRDPRVMEHTDSLYESLRRPVAEDEDGTTTSLLAFEDFLDFYLGQLAFLGVPELPETGVPRLPKTAIEAGLLTGPDHVIKSTGTKHSMGLALRHKNKPWRMRTDAVQFWPVEGEPAGRSPSAGSHSSSMDLPSDRSRGHGAAAEATPAAPPAAAGVAKKGSPGGPEESPAPATAAATAAAIAAAAGPAPRKSSLKPTSKFGEELAPAEVPAAQAATFTLPEEPSPASSLSSLPLMHDAEDYIKVRFTLVDASAAAGGPRVTVELRVKPARPDHIKWSASGLWKPGAAVAGGAAGGAAGGIVRAEEISLDGLDGIKGVAPAGPGRAAGGTAGGNGSTPAAAKRAGATDAATAGKKAAAGKKDAPAKGGGGCCCCVQ